MSKIQDLKIAYDVLRKHHKSQIKSHNCLGSMVQNQRIMKAKSLLYEESKKYIDNFETKKEIYK